MRALFLVGVAFVAAFSVEPVRGDEPPAVAAAQVASCPTELPVAEGERSIIVPTVDPHVAAPHVATRLPTPEQEPARALLAKKLAERDRLEREIAALRESTNTPEQILVRVKMLEVNLAQLRRSGIDLPPLMGTSFAAMNPKNRTDAAHVPPAGRADFGFVTLGNESLALFDQIEQRKLGNVLAEPSLVTTSGQPASITVGGELPIPQPGQDGGVKTQPYGTQLDVVATALGENRVRLQVRPRVSEIDSTHSIEIAGQPVPALTVRSCDTCVELEFGTSAVLAGLIQQRKASGPPPAAGAGDATEEVALVVVVTPEIVR